MPDSTGKFGKQFCIEKSSAHISLKNCDIFLNHFLVGVNVITYNSYLLTNFQPNPCVGFSWKLMSQSSSQLASSQFYFIFGKQKI